MTEREKALKRVQIHSFAMADASLYLDSHPTDQEALAYFKKHRNAYNMAKEEYVNKFGPLSHGDLSENATKWEWVNDPWPWEMEA